MRKELKVCRLCATPSESISTISFRDRGRKSVIRKIFQITGVMLKNLSNIPTAMCSGCETELNRAYAFRERCINAQTYFSSAEYKNYFGRIRNLTKFSKSKDVESNLVKTMSSKTEDENEVKIEGNRHFEGVFKAETYTECELAFNENEIDHLGYNDGEVELLDQPMENKSQNKALKNTEVALENRLDDNEKVVDTIPILLEKVVKSELDVKNSKKAQQKNNSKEERKNKSKIYICDQCGNHFKCPTHFHSHLRRHTGIKPLQCDICPNKFFTEGELKRHMRRHTGERPFPCKYCQRRFSDYSSRIKHERTHTNERPFKCQQCDKAFTNSYVLKNHMLVHTGERPYKCVPCDKSFQRETHISTHNRSLAHKRNVEREQQKLLQRKNEEML